MPKSNLVKPAMILFLICLITTGLVAMTFVLTADTREMQRELSDSKNRRLLFAQAQAFEAIELSDEQIKSGLVDAYRAFDAAGLELGLLVTAQTRGYGGDVPVMVAVGSDRTILAIQVLSNDETPGLGQKVADSLFSDQFSNQPADSLYTVDSSDNAIQVDAVIGATISSRAVTDAVNLALAFYTTVNEPAAKPVSLEQTRQQLFAEASAFEEVTLTAQQKLLGIVEAHAAFDDESSIIGHTVVAHAKGYEDYVSIMISLSPDDTIFDVVVLDNSESGQAALQLKTVDFTAQFTEKSAASRFSIEANDSGQIQIDASAGATVSSRAAVRAVNIALDYYMNNLRVVEIEEPFEAYREILFPQAAKFSDLDLGENEIASGLLEAAVALSDSDEKIGYFIVSQGQGHGGPIPVILAIGIDEVISGMIVLPEFETQDVGTQVAEITYVDQFIGQPASNLFALVDSPDVTQVDTVAGATQSSQAVVDAINLALDFFGGQLAQQNMLQLFPTAETFNQLELDEDQLASGLLEAYAAADASDQLLGYLVSAKAPGYGGFVKTMVSINLQGVITGLTVQAGSETQGLGSLVSEDDFTNHLVGQTSTTRFGIRQPGSGFNPDDLIVDAVSGATESSKAVLSAVNLSLEYFNLNLAEVQSDDT